VLRTYATVSKMGVNPPNSTIDPPVAVADNVWPVTQYGTCLKSGLQDQYRAIIPSGLIAAADYVMPASVAVAVGTATLAIRSSGNASNGVWLAPAGTTRFSASASMTQAAGDATVIAVPGSAGTYKLSVVDSTGSKVGESAAAVRVK
jgi:hypothetical protein